MIPIRELVVEPIWENTLLNDDVVVLIEPVVELILWNTLLKEVISPYIDEVINPKEVLSEFWEPVWVLKIVLQSLQMM